MKKRKTHKRSVDAASSSLGISPVLAGGSSYDTAKDVTQRDEFA